MAFWGVEVKPGKRFTHEHDDSKGRLHISMATLGFGSATAKSTLQCNVGSRSPVYVCSLYPGSTESLQLNLELEEADEVIFTVIGPRSIHLCGYYIGSGGGTGRNANIDDDSEETYGEDIADSETQSSDDSDEYGGSFIDDDAVPEVFPPSPISNEEETSHENRKKGRKGRFRRLRKKYQSVESDGDWNFKEKTIVNDNMHDQTKEIDDEDSLPISSVYKSKASRRILDEEMNDSGDRGGGDASNKNGEEGGNHIIQTDLTTDNVLVDSQMHREDELADHLVDPCTVLAARDIETLNKKKKGKGEEIKSSFNGDSIKHGNTLQDEPKMDKVTPDLVTGNEQNQEHADDKDIVDPCTVLDATDIETFQKKKKGKGKEIKSSYGDSVEIENTMQDEPKIDEVTPGLVTGNGQNQEHADDMDIVDPCTDLDAGDTETLKEREEGKGIEIKSSFNGDSIKLVNTLQNEPKMDKVTPGLVTGNEQNQEHADDMDIVDPCTDLDAGDTETLKEKEKGKGIEIKSSFNADSIKLVNTLQNEPKMDKVTPDLVTGNEQNQEHAGDMDIVGPCTDLDAGDTEALNGKEQGKAKEIKSSFNGDSIMHVNTLQNEPKMDEVTPNLLTRNEQNQERADDEDIVDPCTDLDAGNTETLKEKEKGKGIEIKSTFNGDSITLENTVQDEPKMDEETPDLLAESEHNQEHADNKDIVDPCTVLDAGHIETLKEKKKGKGEEIKSSFNVDSIKLVNTEQDEPKMDEVTPDLLTGNEQNQEHADDRETETMDKVLPSSEIGHEQGEKPKKKRKEQSRDGLALIGNGAHDSHLVNLPQRNEHNKPPTVNKNVELADSFALLHVEKDSEKRRTKRRKKKQVNKGTHVEGDIGYHEDIVEECKAKRDKAESDNLIHNFSEAKEQHQKPTNEKSVDYGAHDFPDGIQNEEKVKKRKKKSKSQGNIEVNFELPLSVEQISEMEKEDVNKRANAKHSQVRTLSNGLSIQELEMGKKDGKIATTGKKISIHYTGKLKESGEVIESNAGQAPFKFRLGKGEVIECWDVGLQGMRVGGKRRLVIPPSMMSESEDYREKIPPNSWLVYDFELVKVR